MKKKPITYFAIVLDRSGSMASTKNATITGFNEQVQQLIEDSKENDIRVCLITFNGEVYEHLWLVSADKLVEATPESYVPLGGTAMRDAMGYTIQKLLDTTDPTDENVAYTVCMISDGQTLNDKHYSEAQINELVTGCEATKRFTFVYMGCGDKKELEETAQRTGIPVTNVAAWDNSTDKGAGTAHKNMRKRQKKYFAERAMGQMATRNYVVLDAESFCPRYSDAELPDVAPAPQLDSTPGVALDIPELMNKMPKYVQQVAVNYDGTTLFGNSQKVQWVAGDEANKKNKTSL